MEQDIQTRALGLYIHLPWCLTRCPYCVFFALPFDRKAFEDYFALLLEHKELMLPLMKRPLTSVYLGGGTPSLLSGAQISELLKKLPLADHAEITLEVNPIQITPAWAEGIMQSPVNRISLGLQSFSDEELRYLGRRHKTASIPSRIGILRDAGFDDISADLIYGLPRQSLADVEYSLRRLTELPLSHVSTYLLEINANGPLAGDIPALPPDEELEGIYHLIRKHLQTAGYRQYEISNFARPCYESSHNLLYWQGDECLPLGAAACGYMGGIRYENPADLAAYRQQIQQGRALGDPDPAADETGDYIMMRMRLCKGLSLSEFSARFAQDFTDLRKEKIARLQELGLIELEGDLLRLAEPALFISNAVIGELL